MKRRVLQIKKSLGKGFTLIELLVVIAIIGLLASLLALSASRALEMANVARCVSSLKEITTSTLVLINDLGGKVPSPEYPGGVVVASGYDPDEFFPKYWDLLPESGLWLDGVVFGEMYLKMEDQRAEDDGDTPPGDTYGVNADGGHLEGTHFLSVQSVKKDPEERNLHKHSYAMNKNLQYDRINDNNGSEDPWLTEKTMANLNSVKAMLYIECKEKNVVEFQDMQLILDTIEERWSSKKAIVSYLDGHVERLRASEIPEGDVERDRDTSWFWRGVNVKR